MHLLQTLQEQLLHAKYSERGGLIFHAPGGPRVVALVEALPEPRTWPAQVDTVLRLDIFRMAPTWSRYAVVLVPVAKTPQLAAAAAAFCRDVSKCRRLVGFADQTAHEVLPFLALPSVPGGSGTPGYDLEAIANGSLDSTELASAFLSDETATTYVQDLAEGLEK